MAIGTIPPVFGEQPLTVGSLGAGGLRQGQIIEARVLERVSADVLRLATASGRLDVVLPKSGITALPQPGSIVHLQVGHASSAGTPILQFIDGPARGLTVTLRPTETMRPAGATAPPPTQPQAVQAPPENPRLAALDAAVSQALKVQTGAAGLFAGATALMGAPAGMVPREVQVVLERLLGLRIGGQRPATAATVQSALQTSGILHEARAAKTGRPPADMKAVLADLRGALGRWLDAPTADAARRAEPPSDGARPSLGSGEPAEASSPPDPPRRGSPVEGQPARNLPTPADPAVVRTLAARVMEDAERVGARVLLHQAASLDGERGETRIAREATQHWSFEVPLAGPSGTSIADLRIERDDHHTADPGGEGRTWRVQIGLAVDPLGPLTARIALLADRRIVVALWCERPGSVEPLEAGAAELRTALESAGLQVAVIDVKIGRPPDPGSGQPINSPYHRIDRSL